MGRKKREYNFIIVNSAEEIEECMAEVRRGVAEDYFKNKGDKLVSTAIALYENTEFMEHLRNNTWEEFLNKKGLSLEEYGEMLVNDFSKGGLV